MRVAMLAVLLSACSESSDAAEADTAVGDSVVTDEGTSLDTAVADAPTMETGPLRRGSVRLDGRVLRDDGGPFLGLGTTMMWAAWAYKNDRPKLEAALSLLSKNGFNYIRALGVVGDYTAPDGWDGREIDWHWPDYADVIAGLTDLAFDKYALRVEWTLIGDGQKNIPDEADRKKLVDTFIAMSKGREHKIMHFEIANEAWQNGFSGDTGLAQLRALSSDMKGKTEILVAASAPDGQTCGDWQRMYNGGIADLATIHFDRDISTVEGGWRPVRMPWELGNCMGMPVGSNNEPIGPGSSVASENEPVRLVAAAITTWVAQLPFYVLHTRAGVRGDVDFATMPGIDAFVGLMSRVPADLPGWERKNMQWADAPFVFYADDQADKTWPEVAGATSGVIRAYGAVKGDEFFVFPIGIKSSVTIAPRKNLDFEVIDPMNGKSIGKQTLDAGKKVSISGGEALILRGRYR
jgi:hypothetical protein